MPQSPIDLIINAKNRSAPVFNRATRDADKFRKSIGDIGRGALSVGRTVLTTFTAVSAALVGLFIAAQRSAREMVLLETRAQSLGVTTRQLQTTLAATEIFSTREAEQVFDAMETFAERVGEAASDAQSEIGRVFRDLDVAVTDSEGNVRSSLDVWDDFNETISRLPLEQQSFYLAEIGDVMRDVAGPLARNNAEFQKYRERLNSLTVPSNNLREATADTSTELGAVAFASSQAFEALGGLISVAVANTTEWLGLATAISKATDNLLDFFNARDNEELRDEIEDLQDNERTLTNRIRLRQRQLERSRIRTGSDESEEDKLLLDLQAQLAAATEERIQKQERLETATKKANDEARAAARPPAASTDTDTAISRALNESQQRLLIQQAIAAENKREAETLMVLLSLNLEDNEANREKIKGIVDANLERAKSIDLLKARKKVGDDEDAVEKSLFETTLERYRTRQQELQLAEIQLLVAEATGEVTRQEAEALREILRLRTAEAGAGLGRYRSFRGTEQASIRGRACGIAR